MKIRNGFVSNSSSSSFIVGVSKIVDYNKFQERLKEIGISTNYEIMVKTVAEVKQNTVYETVYHNGVLTVESFVSGASLYIEKMDDNDLLFIVNIANNEGDYGFMSSSYGDIDYDIDLSFFPKEQQDLYKMFLLENGGLDVDNYDVRYGAARNG